MSDEDEIPCCDYRDHGGNDPTCACPNHVRSELHPFGALEPTKVEGTDVTYSPPDLEFG